VNDPRRRLHEIVALISGCGSIEIGADRISRDDLVETTARIIHQTVVGRG